VIGDLPSHAAIHQVPPPLVILVMHQAKTYGGWLRNPAPPKGWLKPEQNDGMYHLSTGAGFRNHPQY
jgi:hypothetical protein